MLQISPDFSGTLSRIHHKYVTYIISVLGTSEVETQITQDPAYNVVQTLQEATATLPTLLLSSLQSDTISMSTLKARKWKYLLMNKKFHTYKSSMLKIWNLQDLITSLLKYLNIF